MKNVLAALLLALTNLALAGGPPDTCLNHCNETKVYPGAIVNNYYLLPDSGTSLSFAASGLHFDLSSSRPQASLSGAWYQDSQYREFGGFAFGIGKKECSLPSCGFIAAHIGYSEGGDKAVLISYSWKM